MADPEFYRRKEETERWRELDPILTFRKKLTNEGVIDDTAFEMIEEEIEQNVREAVEFAEESPAPPLEDLYAAVYKENS